MIIIYSQVILKRDLIVGLSAWNSSSLMVPMSTLSLVPENFIWTHIILFFPIGFIPTSDQIKIFKICFIVTNTMICIIIGLFVMQTDYNDGRPRAIFNSIKSRKKFIIEIDWRDFKLDLSNRFAMAHRTQHHMKNIIMGVMNHYTGDMNLKTILIHWFYLSLTSWTK